MTALELYRTNLFADEKDMAKTLRPEQIERVLAIRDLYQYVLANPSEPDRVVIEWYQQAHSYKHSQAYTDLGIVKQLMPLLTTATKDFHRYRYNEMILATYNQAKQAGDLKTMERAASSYARFNRVDEEDLQNIPYEDIVVQPFTATDDPTVLGIKPIPNLRNRIDQLLHKYGADNPDIQDIDYEPADL